jgi:HlyD family secretion protein
MKSSKNNLTARKRNRGSVAIRWFISIVIMMLLAGGGAAWYFFWGPGSTQANATAGSETYTTAVKRGDLSISASGSGKLVANQSVDLSFSTSGAVNKLNVKLGDLVKTGQELASLGSSNTLEANLASAELQVLNAQKTLTDLQQNASVSLAQAYSDLLTAQDTYDTALTNSQKVDTTRCSKEVTTRYKANLERATQNLENVKAYAEKPGSDIYIAAKKQYDTALANYTYCASHTSDEKTSAQSALGVAKTTLQEAQAKYDTLKAASGIDPDELAMDEAKLKEAQAKLAKAKDQLAGITLTSPIDGKVTYLAASTGEIVSTAKFITIADVSHPTIDISVDESDMSKLVVGSAVTVSFDALTNQSFSGKVTQLNPQMTQSGQYHVAKGLVQLDEDSVKVVSTLPLGISATVKIINQEAKNALLAPVMALKDLGDNTYGVMVKGGDGQIRLQVVTIGIQDSDYVEITSGLKEGDLVSTGITRFIAAGSTDNSSSLKNSQNSGGFPGGPGGPP